MDFDIRFESISQNLFSRNTDKASSTHPTSIVWYCSLPTMNETGTWKYAPRAHCQTLIGSRYLLCSHFHTGLKLPLTFRYTFQKNPRYRFSSKMNIVIADATCRVCSFHPILVLLCIHLFLCEMQYKNAKNYQSWCYQRSNTVILYEFLH